MNSQKGFTHQAAEQLVRFRLPLALAVGALIACLSLCALSIGFENSVESFLPKSDPARQFYKEFKDEFGDDQIIALVIQTGDVFDKDTLTNLDALSEALESIEGVRKVRSITTAKDIVGSQDGFEVRPFLEKIPDTEAERLALKQSALQNPLYQIDLVSLDGAVASVLIEAELSTDPNRYRSLYKAIRSALSGSPFADAQTYIAGTPLVELQMTKDMYTDLGTFVPLTYVCLAVLLLLAFGNLQGVLAPLIVISMCMGSLMGAIGALGITMNAVTVGLPSLILCIASLDCIHVLSSFRQLRSKIKDTAEAITAAVQENLAPCLITTLTTAGGFLSVAVSDLVPIREFGFLAACGTLACYPICFSVMPLLVSWIPFGETSHSERVSKAIERQLTASLPRVYSYTAPIYVLTILLALTSLYGMTRITTETNHLSFLRERSQIKQSTNFIETHLGGVTPLEIVIDTGEEGRVKEPRVLRSIAGLQDYLDTLEHVDKTVSPVQFIREMHQAMNEDDPAFYALPNSRELVAQYILTYSFSGRDQDLDDFVDYSYRKARIRGRLSIHSSADAVVLLDKAAKYISEHFPADLKATITSHTVMQSRMVNTLVAGQMLGIGIALVLAVVVLGVVHRSFLLGLLSLLPNTAPILAVGGIMGLCGISLNAGTAMIACIAFGLIVDDTVYFLHYSRKAFQSSLTGPEAMKTVLRRVGPALLYTSLVLSGGFGILLLGQSKLTVFFGGLCAFAVITALVCDLVLLPIILLSSKRIQNAFK